MAYSCCERQTDEYAVEVQGGSISVYYPSNLQVRGRPIYMALQMTYGEGVRRGCHHRTTILSLKAVSV